MDQCTTHKNRKSLSDDLDAGRLSREKIGTLCSVTSLAIPARRMRCVPGGRHRRTVPLEWFPVEVISIVCRPCAVEERSCPLSRGAELIGLQIHWQVRALLMCGEYSSLFHSVCLLVSFIIYSFWFDSSPNHSPTHRVCLCWMYTFHTYFSHDANGMEASPVQKMRLNTSWCDLRILFIYDRL